MVEDMVLILSDGYRLSTIFADYPRSGKRIIRENESNLKYLDNILSSSAKICMLLARILLCFMNKCVHLAIVYNHKHILHKKSYFYFLCIYFLNNRLPIRVQSKSSLYP
jgi:hypothetical protein